MRDEDYDYNAFDECSDDTGSAGGSPGPSKRPSKPSGGGNWYSVFILVIALIMIVCAIMDGCQSF